MPVPVRVCSSVLVSPFPLYYKLSVCTVYLCTVSTYCVVHPVPVRVCVRVCVCGSVVGGGGGCAGSGLPL